MQGDREEGAEATILGTSDYTSKGEQATSDLAFVVEDSKPNAAIATHLLKKMGLEVLEFSNGEAAKEKLLGITESELKRLRIIFSDLMMPKLDGLSLLTFVREQ